MKALTRDIRAWGSSQGLVLPEMSALLDGIAAACQERGIDIEVGEDLRVHCVGVRLAPTSPSVHLPRTQPTTDKSATDNRSPHEHHRQAAHYSRQEARAARLYARRRRLDAPG